MVYGPCVYTHVLGGSLFWRLHHSKSHDNFLSHVVICLDFYYLLTSYQRGFRIGLAGIPGIGGSNPVCSEANLFIISIIA